MKELFRKFAAQVSTVTGSPWLFVIASLMIVGWAITGFVIGFSDRWLLAINTTTTVITFLMVFLIQNSQNRHALSTQIKLDELIRSIGAARNQLIDLEHLSDEELSQLKQGFERIRDRANRDADGQGGSGPHSDQTK